jgi:hypothetical protein
MRYRFLGGTGLPVSELCLGAMTFGREADEASSRRILDGFVGAGGTFIDTADVYAGGVSEEILGRWLKNQDRDRLVIATKVRWGATPATEGLGRSHILPAVETSLRRLGTDHIDLYQVHGWDPVTPPEETLRILDALVTSGRVRYLGVSNWAAWQIQKAQDIARHRGWEAFACLQPLYNLLDRDVEWDRLCCIERSSRSMTAEHPAEINNGSPRPPDNQDIEGELARSAGLNSGTRCAGRTSKGRLAALISCDGLMQQCRSPPPSTPCWLIPASRRARSRHETRGRTPRRRGSSSPPAPRSPTACSSSASDINGHRRHRALQLQPPRSDGAVTDLTYERIRRRPVLGGLITEYERAA